jgi:3-oxoacyl-[acyl-carrier-protein] synthase II
MADAGLNKENINPTVSGVVFASGIGGLITFQNEVTDFAREMVPPFQSFFIPKMILDMLQARSAMRHNLRGPNLP